MKNLLAVLLLIPAAAVKLAGILAGLVLVPLGIATQYMSLDGWDRKHWPEVLWLWGNAEDGVNPQWWQDRHPSWPHWWQAFVWLAIRNPFNNSRYLFKDVKPAELDVLKSNWVDVHLGPMEPMNMAAVGVNRAWYFVRHGWKCGYRVVWFKEQGAGGKYNEFWIGWKLASGVPGLGFTMQLRLKRRMGQ